MTNAFKVARGRFRWQGRKVKEGSIIKSEMPLDKMFPNKFIPIAVPTEFKPVESVKKLKKTVPSGEDVTANFEGVPEGITVRRSGKDFFVYSHDGTLLNSEIALRKTEKVLEFIQGLSEDLGV